MPDQSPLPALPVTFRPGRTRAVLLTAAGAIFVVITVVALLLPTLGPGERLSFVFTAAMLAATPASPAPPGSPVVGGMTNTFTSGGAFHCRV